MKREGNRLTKKQIDLLKFLFRYRQEYGEAPSLSVIVKNQELSSNRSVIDMIRLLVKKGYLTEAPKISRSTLLTTKAMNELRLLSPASNELHYVPRIPKLNPTDIASSSSPKPRQASWAPTKQPSGTSSIITDDFTKLLRNTASLLNHLGTGWRAEPEKNNSSSGIMFFLASCVAIPLTFGRGIQAAVIFLLSLLIIRRSS